MPVRPEVFVPRPAGRLASAALLLSCLAALAGCGSAGRDAAPAAGGGPADARVRAASAAWDSAHNAGDAAALGRLYADSAVSMPYGRPALEGRAAIEADFRGFVADFDARHRTTIVAIECSGDLAVEHGRYEFEATPKTGGAGMRESGKHLVVRRFVAGEWKIAWEIWNTDAPPPAP